MEVSLKYAVIERERRYLVSVIPDGVIETRIIVDHYLDGTRLRLREVTTGDGRVVHKLTQKIRLSNGPHEIACTNVYVNDVEWALLRELPARSLRKTRHIIEQDGYRIAVDAFQDGSLLAEIDDGDAPRDPYLPGSTRSPMYRQTTVGPGPRWPRTRGSCTRAELRR